MSKNLPVFILLVFLSISTVLCAERFNLEKNSEGKMIDGVYIGGDPEKFRLEEKKNPFTAQDKDKLLLKQDTISFLGQEDYSFDLNPSFRAQKCCLLLAGVGMMVTLLKNPPVDLNWDKESGSSSMKDMPKKWKRNVSRGPVSDNDPSIVNYMFHPYVGGCYYVMARESGYSKGKSFIFTLFTSTVFWEYGIEAFYEVPSSQDLITTPIAGAIVGELMYRARQKLEKSRFRHTLVGKILRFTLNPIGGSARIIQKILKSVGRNIELTGKFFMYQPIGVGQNRPDLQHIDSSRGMMACEFEFKF